MLPLDTSIQAEYEDGYIHDETTLNDISPYNKEKNIFDDIINKRPEAEHGKLVRYSLFYKDNRHDIYWNTLPENARPIRFRHGFFAELSNGDIESGFSSVDFGYQYNDKNGKNVQEVVEL